MDDDSIYSLIDELTTISLFDIPKFVIVKEIEKLADIKEKKQTLELISAINNRDSQNVVVFLFTKEFDFKSINLQKLKKYDTYFDIRIKNILLDEYTKKSLLEKGYKIRFFYKLTCMFCWFIEQFKDCNWNIKDI